MGEHGVPNVCWVDRSVAVKVSIVKFTENHKVCTVLNIKIWHKPEV